MLKRSGLKDNLFAISSINFKNVMERGDLSLITTVNNGVNARTPERYTQFSAFICDCWI